MRFVRSGSVDGFATKHCHLPTHHDLPSSAPGHAFGERSSFVQGRSSQGEAPTQPPLASSLFLREAEELVLSQAAAAAWLRQGSALT